METFNKLKRKEFGMESLEQDLLCMLKLLIINEHTAGVLSALDNLAQLDFCYYVELTRVLDSRGLTM